MNRKISQKMFMFKSNKMKSINAITKLFLIIICLTTIMPAFASAKKTVESYDLCPEQCKCTKIMNDNNNRLQNHAKCYGVDGIKEDGRNLSIHSLDLSNNNLTRISNSLEKLKDLISLDLSNNHLSEIGRFGKRIQKLNLSNNRITSGKLQNLPQHLKYLDLSFNDITYLPNELKNLKYLKSIELSGNKIHCTCETLEIRNWLQDNHVWTNNYIKCAYPIELKGKSWLQVKQSDLCNNYNTSKTIIDDENELMFGDEPAINNDDGSGEEEEIEELGKDYLPIGNVNGPKLSEYKAIEEEEEGDDGSGDEGLLFLNTSSKVTTEHSSAHEDITTSSEKPVETETDEYDEEEASGDEPIVLTTEETVETVETILDNNENENNETDLIDDDYDENSTSILSGTVPDFGTGLGIVQFVTSTTEPISPELSKQTTEDIILPEKVAENEAIKIRKTETNESLDVQNASIKVPSDEDPNQVLEASSNENRNTYILLGVILAILVGLIMYVAIKRNRNKRRSNRQNDAENPKETELLDMDKKNLGKPTQRNGAKENVPLINDRTKADLAKPISANGKKSLYDIQENDKNAQEPLLKNDENEKHPETNRPQTESNNNLPNGTLEESKSTPTVVDVEDTSKTEQNENKPVPAETAEETKNNINGNVDKPSEPVHHSKYGAYPPPKSKPSSGDETEGYNSSSPRPSRYSPVYSPETGRVKIKLTETPKPKTPLLITRSRSNAGDIITTPTSRMTSLKGTPTNNVTDNITINNNNSTSMPTMNGSGQ